jgi:uncharacterized protein (DUF1778 family)
MKHPRRTHAITFRVAEDEYNQIALAALEAGTTPTDWCRDHCIDKSEARDRMMSEGQRIMFQELATLRFLVGSVVGTVAIESNLLTKEKWEEMLRQAREQAAQHSNQLLAHYESKWFFRNGEAHPREPKVDDSDTA